MLYIYLGAFLVIVLTTQVELKSFKIWKWKQNK